MSHAEFIHWMALYEIEPYGEEADYFRAGIVASTIANCNKSKDAEPFTAIDFMPFYKSGKVESEPLLDPDPEVQSKLLEAFFNGIASTA